MRTSVTPQPAAPAGTRRTLRLQLSLPHRMSYATSAVTQRGLTAERRQAIVNELPETVTYADTLTQTQRTTGATRKCWTLRRDGDTRGGVNNVPFTFCHVARWCVNGSTMEGTDLVDHGASLVGPGWRDEGRPAYDAAVVNNQGRSYSQFKFTFGAGGWYAIVPTPCLRVIASPEGTATTSTTCGIY